MPTASIRAAGVARSLANREIWFADLDHDDLNWNVSNIRYTSGDSSNPSETTIIC
jgi:hypothetical protein